MDVRLSMSGQVELNDGLNIGNIKTASGHISRNLTKENEQKSKTIER